MRRSAGASVGRPVLASIIIPAHNEEAVIGRSLTALLEGARPGEFDVLVVCNGCTDRTAQIARGFGESVRVLETEVGSKTHALNLGDAATDLFPRIYMDADVLLPAAGVRALLAALQRPGVLAAAPRAKLAFPPGSGWAVRAFHAFWMALPYIQEGMVTAGVYAVSAEGRERFGRFPDIIADDGFFRMHFSADERVEAADAVSTVWTPGNLRDLVRTRTRSRLGLYQLRERYPQLFERETGAKDYRGALRSVLRRPGLWPAAAPYLWVNLVSRRRAASQLKATQAYQWERDNSSRVLADTAKSTP